MTCQTSFGRSQESSAWTAPVSAGGLSGCGDQLVRLANPDNIYMTTIIYAADIPLLSPLQS